MSEEAFEAEKSDGDYEEKIQTIVAAVADLQQAVRYLAEVIAEQQELREGMAEETKCVLKVIEDKKRRDVVGGMVKDILKGRARRDAEYLRKRLVSYVI